MLTKIKFICKEKKIPICKLERDLGFARGYVYKLGTSKPSIENAKKIADYLKIKIEQLL